jgi:hypothetical protein
MIIKSVSRFALIDLEIMTIPKNEAEHRRDRPRGLASPLDFGLAKLICPPTTHKRLAMMMRCC